MFVYPLVSTRVDATVLRALPVCKWKHIGDPRVECLYYELQFVEHSTRIRAHLARSSGVGVADCSAVPEEVKQDMITVTQEL
jgi:hypothetical protein